MFKAKVSAAHLVISQTKQEVLESRDKSENNKTDIPWALSVRLPTS